MRSIGSYLVIVTGSLNGTGLAQSTITVDAGAGNDTLDLRDRTSPHRVVADGKANDAVTRLLSEALGVGRAAIEVVRGDTSRRKTIRARGVALARVMALAGESRK